MQCIVPAVDAPQSRTDERYDRTGCHEQYHLVLCLEEQFGEDTLEALDVSNKVCFDTLAKNFDPVHDTAEFKVVDKRSLVPFHTQAFGAVAVIRK